MKKLFLLAGEVSGDTHGSGLMRALGEIDSGMQFSGFGGHQMRAVGGPAMIDWVEDAGVVGLWEVLKMYGWFKQKMEEAVSAVAEGKPDAVILIDYPGFNLRLAQRLRDASYQGRIIYYISPQVWAWKKGRIKTMAKLLDLMICIFPFEKDLYEKSGLRTEFAGHPMVDRLKTLTNPQLSREPGLVGFFPGSRKNEVRRLFPVMLETAKRIRQEMPGARFVVSAANPRLATLMEEIIATSDLPEAKQWIEVGTVYELMQRAQVGIVASGTATLEAACFGLPYLLVYKVNALTYVVGKTVVRIKYLGIINVLAGNDAPVVKEMVQGLCKPDLLAKETLVLLKDPSARELLVSRLQGVVIQLGEGGAYRRAAEAVTAQLPSP